MATINNMLSGTYSLYKSSYANGSLFSSINNKSKNNDAISSLWSSYTSSASNANEALSGLSMISSNVKSVLSSYNTAKETFYSEMDENLSELGKTSEALKGYDFKLKDTEKAITTTETTDKEGKVTKTTNYSDELKAAMKAVTDFVDDYNDNVKFFNDNSSVSKRVSRMATVFGDTTYRSGSYESIGLNVKSDGSLEVDEEKLAKTITENPSKVSNVLGKGGLADKAESHIDTVKTQRSQLFPSAKSMLGSELSTAAIYTGRSYQTITSLNSVGNLINMMF